MATDCNSKSLTFLQRKTAVFFRKADVYNNGYLTYEGITQGTIERAKKNFQMDDSPLLKSYAKFLPLVWNEFYEPLAEEVEGEKRVMLDVVLSVDRSTPKVRKATEWVSDMFFDMADANHDGLIDPDEFGWLLLFWGCTDQKDREFAFQVIDVNHDGLITREEFRKAIVSYFCDEEDNNGKYMWGTFEDDDIELKK